MSKKYELDLKSALHYAHAAAGTISYLNYVNRFYYTAHLNTELWSNTSFHSLLFLYNGPLLWTSTLVQAIQCYEQGNIQRAARYFKISSFRVIQGLYHPGKVYLAKMTSFTLHDPLHIIL